ncbi:OB-fold nucleic acid binding domain-containing protein [Halobaculum sp. MBLA0147]|uniref:OB-fold nucleic acid binding domain-containing protein n=1 Tax=Halobaculum sp. MBLA0147 TaxID=3079934 RepID=UPI0035241751
MGTCIICGTDTDGRICDSHEQDVVFEFKGSDPSLLRDGRFYRGTVDGYADFGVFVDVSPDVTGLLHRSELDQRLESLDWEPGDTVYVQVKGVRDNGNVDLAWSIRQAEREFRGSLVQDGQTDREPTANDAMGDDGDDGDGRTRTDATDDGSAADGADDETTADAADDTDADESDADTGADGAGSGDDAAADAETDGQVTHQPSPAEDDRQTADDSSFEFGAPTEDADEAADESDDGTADAAEPSDDTAESTADAETVDDSETTDDPGTETETDTERDADATAETADETETADDTETDADDDTERVAVDSLESRVGETVRLEGEITDARQTSGPTVFELRDETGTVDCAAFVEAGVRAYPGIEVGETVRLEGEVERRRDEIQVETEALAALEGADAEAVEARLAEAMRAKTRPDEVTTLADHPAVDAVSESLLDAAEAIHRAVLSERPIVVRHAATADGYAAGAAVERATLPLVRAEHPESDAEYHFFDRRPLDGSVYDMDAATNDTTRMLSDRERHGEKLPLVLLLGTGSTEESADGLGLLGVYGAERVVVDPRAGDEAVADSVETMVNPAPTPDAPALTTAALAATLAATVNPDAATAVSHLPAVSYWESTPTAFADLAAEAGYDDERVAQLREAIALEAFYQQYEDKRELVADLLFEDDGDLAAHVAAQFRERLETELDTAAPNVETHEVDGRTARVLDADAFAHRYDFPPTALLADELHRRHGGVVVVLGDDDLYVRADDDVDVRAVADAAGEAVPDGAVTAAGVREGRIEYLTGRREAVCEAVLDAVAEAA